MTRLRADFLYNTKNLWVAPEVEGTSRSIDTDGFNVVLRIPTDDEVGDRLTSRRTVRSGSYSGTPEDAELSVGIAVVQVLVEGDGDVSREALTQDSGAASYGFEFLNGAQAVADRVVAEFIDWIRVRGQAGLGLHGQVPELTGIQSLIDLETGARLPLAWPAMRSVIEVIDHAIAVDSGAFDELTQHIAARRPLPTAETLLADARFMVREPDADPSRAVLAAAIAAEVKLKERLRQLVAVEKLSLLDLLLENPRDFSVAAIALFDEVLEAATGASLRKADSSLHKRIQRLYEVRNRIAHRGERPNLDFARDAVSAVSAVFEFLESLGKPPVSDAE